MADINANTVEAAVNEELKAYEADELKLEDVIRELKKIKTAQPSSVTKWSVGK